MYTTQVVESITGIEQNQWDALRNDNPYMKYGWLKTYELMNADNVKPLYILVLRDYELVGATVCYIFQKGISYPGLDYSLFGRLRKIASRLTVSLLPALICCPGRGRGKHFLIARDCDSAGKERISRTLLDTIEREANNCSLSIVFNNVLEEDGDLRCLLSKNNYCETLSLPLNYLNVTWNTFKEYKMYVRKIKPSMKKTINREINKSRKEGVIIQPVHMINAYEKELYQLLDANQRKYNARPIPFREGFLSELKHNLNDDVIIYSAVKNGKLQGTSLCLKQNDVAFVTMVGVNHALAKNDCTYFNIAYYRPIEDAISWGIKKMYFGNAMYAMKMRRGCLITDTYIFYKPVKGYLNALIKPWFYIQGKWYKKKFVKARNRKPHLEKKRKNK